MERRGRLGRIYNAQYGVPDLRLRRPVQERQRGIGMRVSADAARPAEDRLRMLDQKIEELWQQAEQLGLDRQSVITYLSTVKEKLS